MEVQVTVEEHRSGQGTEARIGQNYPTLDFPHQAPKLNHHNNKTLGRTAQLLSMFKESSHYFVPIGTVFTLLLEWKYFANLLELNPKDCL